jgi:hypothetical protein
MCWVDQHRNPPRARLDVQDEYVESVGRTAGIRHEPDEQLDISAPFLDYLIASECDCRHGGGSNVLKWCIPHYFPAYRFTDMQQVESSNDGEYYRHSLYTWTAYSEAYGETWEFKFLSAYNPPMEEYSFTLLFASRH